MRRRCFGCRAGHTWNLDIISTIPQHLTVFRCPRCCLKSSSAELEVGQIFWGLYTGTGASAAQTPGSQTPEVFGSPSMCGPGERRARVINRLRHHHYHHSSPTHPLPPPTRPPNQPTTHPPTSLLCRRAVLWLCGDMTSGTGGGFKFEVGIDRATTDAVLVTDIATPSQHCNEPTLDAHTPEDTRAVLHKLMDLRVTHCRRTRFRSVVIDQRLRTMGSELQRG